MQASRIVPLDAKEAATILLSVLHLRAFVRRRFWRSFKVPFTNVFLQAHLLAVIMPSRKPRAATLKTLPRHQMDFAEQLKSQLDIVDVVRQYVSLKRQGSGRRWKGLCPFHSEKTPSFNVDGGHQYYKCFGCDNGGDVFSFVQQMESLTFPETLRLLAERYGHAMPERQRTGDAEAERFAALLEIHEAAAQIFQDNLRASNGAETRQYLESRNVRAEAVSEFRLGLADASGQQLVQRLRKFGEALLLESGLVVKAQDSDRLYDRFRQRLMFPIHNDAGKLIAFGGRALRPDDKAKYLNSPETRLYKKSVVLYNMHRAKISARKKDRLILVEGYMDAIGVYSSGVQEVVALCGTALSPVQIRMMKQQTSYQTGRGYVVLNLDSDAAGTGSTGKHITPLLAEGLRVKVLEIPDQLDPDEYIQLKGSEEYGKRLDLAPSYFHWLTDYARGKFDSKTAEGRVDAFKLILPAIELVHDRIERAAIATEVAEQLGIDRDVIRQSLRPKHANQPPPKTLETSSAVPPNEKILLACMLSSADARAVIRHFLAGFEALNMLEFKPLFDAVLAAETPETPFSLPAALAMLDSRLQRILSEIGFSESGVAEEYASQQAIDCLKLLELKFLTSRGDELKKQIRKLEAEGKLDEAFILANQLDALRRASSTR